MNIDALNGKCEDLQFMYLTDLSRDRIILSDASQRIIHANKSFLSSFHHKLSSLRNAESSLGTEAIACSEVGPRFARVVGIVENFVAHRVIKLHRTRNGIGCASCDPLRKGLHVRITAVDKLACPQVRFEIHRSSIIPHPRCTRQFVSERSTQHRRQVLINAVAEHFKQGLICPVSRLHRTLLRASAVGQR